MSMPEDPEFFAVNDRPVKVVSRSDGRRDVMLLNMATGEWERDEGEVYLDRFFRHDGDIDLLTEEQFNARVAEIRAWLQESS